MDYPQLEKYLFAIKNKLICLIRDKFNGSLELRINFKDGGITGVNTSTHDLMKF